MHSDNQLIKKVNRTGDRGAADELIQRYYQEIYAFAYKQTLDAELSMDLTQEIFITVLKGLPLFESKKASFRTWLYRVASNKIIDYFRSSYHRQHMLETNLEDIEEEYYDDMEAVYIQKIYEEQLIQKAMAILVEFGNEWVQIFQLKLFQNKTFLEISKEMNIPENTVKTRYYTMQKKLRKELRL